MINLKESCRNCKGIDACIKGIDIGLHAPAEDYRAAVEFIKEFFNMIMNFFAELFSA